MSYEKFEFHEHPSPKKSSNPFKNTSVRVHFTVYLSFFAILFLIDYMTGGGFWFHWPMMCWGIGMSIHTAVIVITSRDMISMKKGLYIHLAVQCTLIAFFFLIDLFSGGYISWFWFPSFPLLFAWFCHYGAFLFRFPRVAEESEGKPMYSMYNKMLTREYMHFEGSVSEKRHLGRINVLILLAFYIHAVIFAAGLAFILATDLITNINNIWTYWVIIPWGLLLFQHFLASYQFVTSLRFKQISKWYNLFYPASVSLGVTLIVIFRGANFLWALIPSAVFMLIGLVFVLSNHHPNDFKFTPLGGFYFPDDVRMKIYKHQKIKRLADEYPSIRKAIWKKFEEEDGFTVNDEEFQNEYDAGMKRYQTDMQDFKFDMHEFQDEMKNFKQEMKNVGKEIKKEVEKELKKELRHVHIDKEKIQRDVERAQREVQRAQRDIERAHRQTERIHRDKGRASHKHDVSISFEDDLPEKSRKTKFCAGCGAPSEPDFTFCEYCGHKLR